MALPAYTDIASEDSFKSLPEDQKLALTEKYWNAYAEENPDAGDYVTKQRDLASRFITTRSNLDAATPVGRRFVERDVDDAAFALRLNEGVARGQLTGEQAQQELSRYEEGTRDRDERLKKTASLFDPKVQEAMAPAFEALRDTAQRGGVFGSPSLDARISDILPGGEKNAVQGSKDAYASLRKQLANDFHLSDDEIDDVVKHQLGAQEETVSRDAFGGFHVKPDILAQGPQVTEQAVLNSNLPWKSKQQLIEGLPEKIAGYKKNLLESVARDHPDLAAHYRLNTAGTSDDENFQTLLSSLNQGAGSQGLGGVVAGLLGTSELTPLSARDDTYNAAIRDVEGRDESISSTNVQQSINQLSHQMYGKQVEFLGTDAASWGQGAESVAEAVALGFATGGGSGPFSATRIAKMGPVGRTIATGLNSATKVAPIAALGAGKSGMDTYDSAIAAGKTDEEATALGWKSALIEFGVTTGMQALGLGGVEEVGGNLARATTRNAMREAAKTGWKAFGGKLIKGIAEEEFEENLITALDSAMVQTKINPNMTVDDFTKALKDTALVTLGVSLGPVSVSSFSETRSQPTHERSTPNLEVDANLRLADDVLPADENGTTAPAGLTDKELVERGVLPPPPGTSAKERAAYIEQQLGETVEGAVGSAAKSGETLPTELTDKELVARGVLPPPPGLSSDERAAYIEAQLGKATESKERVDTELTDENTPLENEVSPENSPTAVEAVEPEASPLETDLPTGTPEAIPENVEGEARGSGPVRVGEPPSPDLTPTDTTNENEEGQRQGRQEVLNPEDDLTDGEVVPEQPAKEAAYSRDSLKEAFNLDDDQATAADALVQALGLDTSAIRVKKGGTPGSGLAEGPGISLSQGKKAKGSFEVLADGDTLIRGLVNADVSTALHEVSHVARRQLLTRGNEVPGISEQDVQAAEEWAGAKDGKWDVKAEEKFARGFEKYLREGTAPTPELENVFSRIGEWLRSIYKSIKGSSLDVKISPEMRAVLDKMVSRKVEKTEKAPASKPAAPTETKAPKAEKAPPSETSDEGPPPIEVRHRYTEKRRKELGLPERKAEPVFNVQGSIDEADAQVAKNPNAGRDLVEILQKSPRAVTPTELALLNHEQVARELEVEATTKALDGATDENRAEMLEKSDLAVQRLAETMAVLEKTGSLAGANLGARAHMARDREFSRAYLLATTSRDLNDGAPPTAKQRAEIDKFVKDLEAAQARIKELEAERDKLSAAGADRAGQIQKKLEKDIEKALKKVATKDKRDALTAKIDAQAEAARARLASRGKALFQEEEKTVLRSGLAPEDLESIKDYAIIAASYFRKGILNLADLTTKMVEAFGEGIRPFMGAIHQTAVKTYLDAANAVGGAKTPNDVLAGMTPGEAPSRRDVYSLAKAHIIAGLRGTAVLDAVTSDLQSVMPGIDRDTVSAIFTDYGKTIYPSKDEIDVQLRKVRAAEQAALKLQDVLKGKAPLRTGYQREAPDPEVRKLNKELNAAMRAAGIKVTSPAQQLKSSLDSIKTRLRNEIEERRLAIQNRAPMAPGSDPVQYDAEAKALKVELDRVREEYNAVFTKPGLTDKQRLQIAEKSLSRRIAEEEKMLAEGVTSRAREAKMAPWSPQLAAMQKQLDDLREARAAARAALRPSKDEAATAIERAEKALQKSVERMTDILKTGKLPGPSTDAKPWSPTIATLVKERGRLQDAVKALRKRLAPAPKTREERAAAAAVRALDKSIAELDRRITTGDLSMAPKRPDLAGRDPRVVALRKQRNNLRETLEFLRKVTTPPVDPLARKIAQIRKATLTRSLKLREKIRNKDFTVAPKPDRIETPELKRARLREFQLKRRFNEGRLEEALANRTKLQKAKDYATDFTFNLQRAIMTSIDVGGFGRQGGVANITRPEVIPAALKGTFSFTENAADKAQMEMEKDPMFKVAKDSKLALTEWRPGHKLSEMEEVYKSRIAKKIPGVAQSERSYVTGLNATRFAYFKILADGVDPNDKATLKELAKHVNTFTGRGDLGKWENTAAGLATLLFSPKYWWSRLQILGNTVRLPFDVATGFKTYRPEIRQARKMIAWEYARMLRGYTALYGLLGLALKMIPDDEEPFKIGTESTSSDFGKIVMKNGTRVDFLSGLAQNIAFVSRLYQGKKTKVNGDVINLTGPNKGYKDSRGQLIIDMLRSKAAPIPGALANLMFEQTVGGQQVFPETEAVGLYLPISSTETINGFNELGLGAGTAAAISNAFGYGVSTYGQGVQDADFRQDIFTGLHWLSNGKFGYPPSRYAGKSGSSNAVKPAKPAKPKPLKPAKP